MEWHCSNTEMSTCNSIPTANIFQSKSKIKTFLEKQRMGELVTSSPSLTQILRIQKFFRNKENDLIEKQRSVRRN